MTEKTPTRLIEEVRRRAGFPLPTYSVAPMRAGSDSAELRPEPGGYWTPAHIAQEQIALRDEELRELRAKLDACNTIRGNLNQTASRQAVQIADLRAAARHKDNDE
jgi:hypothetical protein